MVIEPRIRFDDVLEQFDHVDDPDASEKATTNTALALALDMSRPRNWQGTGLTPDQILPIAKDSGTPVAWIPPGHVLQALVAAAPVDRMNALESHEVDVHRDGERRNQRLRLLAGLKVGGAGDGNRTRVLSLGS